MAHHHGESHLVRRQRNRDDDNDDNNIVQTVVSVRVVTAQNTFTGKVNWITQEAPKTLIQPAVRPRPTSTSVGGEVKTTTKLAASSGKASTAPSPSQNSDGDDDEASAGTTQESTLMLATKTPTSNALNGIASLASASASISAAASADSAQGMSGGAKAGLALGILVGIGALLVGILLVYRRKKKQQVHLQDNEKVDVYNAPPPPPAQVQSTPAPIPTIVPHPAPSVHTERTISTAPRLSLRPLTQFDPAFDNSKSAGNAMLGVAAAGPLTPSKERDLPERPRSAWERPGAASSAPAENPFNDPQQSGPPSANPFGNNAAVDVSQARIPDSPPNASLLHFTMPSHDLANPAVPISSADINPVIAATATASIPPPTQGLPALPVSNGDAVAPSPASTEDLPASPGPAPTGALPMAGTFAGARSNSPASGPGLNNVYRIQLDFKPSMQDELGLNAGQLVRMLHEYDDGWALCIRMDRSQQGVVPRTCLSKHPVKPRTGPPRQPPPTGMRSPPIRSPMGPGGIPSPRLSPASGPNSPHPPANGQMSPAPGRMSPGPRQMSPHMQGPPRGRSNSNAAYAGPPRSMSPGPYGGGPQMSPPQMGRPRSNSANQATNPRRGPAPVPSPMNPHAGPMPARKPVPGMAL